MLAAHRVRSSLVALSGDIFAGDPPPGERGWTVDISSGQGGNAAEASILLANEGLSTSGDTEQFIDIGGIHYSHIIDPRKGWAITDRRSVTVIGPHGWMHDAVSTALCAGSWAEGDVLLNHYRECAAVYFEAVNGSVRCTLQGKKSLLDRIEFRSE